MAPFENVKQWLYCMSAFGQGTGQQQLSGRYGLNFSVAMVEGKQNWHAAFLAAHAEVPLCVHFGPRRGNTHQDS
jgi:hypothetical protein